MEVLVAIPVAIFLVIVVCGGLAYVLEASQEQISEISEIASRTPSRFDDIELSGGESE